MIDLRARCGIDMEPPEERPTVQGAGRATATRRRPAGDRLRATLGLGSSSVASRARHTRVPVPVYRALDLPAQDLELVAKDKDLDLCRTIGAMLRRDKGEEPTKHHIRE